MNTPHEEDFTLNEITEKVRMYALVPEIMKRLSLIRQKSIARSTVYRAFDEGPNTPTLSLVLKVARMAIIEREQALATEVA
jgi:DNA-binding phage protein